MGIETLKRQNDELRRVLLALIEDKDVIAVITRKQEAQARAACAETDVDPK